MTDQPKNESYAILGAGKQGRILHDLLSSRSTERFIGFMDDRAETDPSESIYNSAELKTMDIPDRVLIPFYYGKDQESGRPISRVAAEKMRARFPKARIIEFPEEIDLVKADIIDCCDELALLLPRAEEVDDIALFGMTSGSEQDYYTKAAIEMSGRPGAIVDLGCWMCSTSIALAQGLQQAGNSTPIYALDRFIWEDWMKICEDGLLCSYEPGESFLPEARSRVGDLSCMIKLIEADLTKYAWTGEPIQLLLVDAMKTWELTYSIAEQFYPALQTGSLLIHQDFKFHAVPWIHLLQYRLRDAFQLHYEVGDASTVSFETLRPLTVEEVRAAARLDNATDEEIAAATAYFAEQLSDHAQASMAGSHINYFTQRGCFDQAQELAGHYSAQTYHDDTELLSSISRLEAHQAQA